MNPANDSLFDFPCDFPLKIMGKSHPEFAETIITVVRQFGFGIE
jgi:putative lipoic acid-binding regulatory protein